jgi:hypothetical protein
LFWTFRCREGCPVWIIFSHFSLHGRVVLIFILILFILTRSRFLISVFFRFNICEQMKEGQLLNDLSSQATSIAGMVTHYCLLLFCWERCYDF